MLKYFSLTFYSLFFIVFISHAQEDSVSFSIKQIIAEEFQQDTSLISKRLDSLQTGVPLVYNLQVDKYIQSYLSRKSEFKNMLKKGKYLFPIFEKALFSFQIPMCFKFLPVIESSMNENAVSKSGAVGLWQFMYKTGLGYKLEINDWNDERKDPTNSSLAAAKYFKDAYKELGDWLLVLAAYNCGTGAVKKAIQKAGGGIKSYWDIQPYLSKQTQNYVPAFIAATYVMSYANLHGIVLDDYFDSGLVMDSIIVNKKINIVALEKSLNLAPNEISSLNPSFKHKIIYASEHKPKRLIFPNSELINNEVVYQAINAQTLEEKVIKNEVIYTSSSEVNIKNSDKKVELNYASNIPKSDISSSNNNTKVDYKSSKPLYIEYTVKVGDTLLKIANKYKGLTVDKIKELNRLTSSFLKIGSTLKLLSFDNLTM